MPANTMVAKYFTKRRAFAMSVGTAGGGLGQAFCNPMLLHLCVELGVYELFEHEVEEPGILHGRSLGVAVALPHAGSPS